MEATTITIHILGESHGTQAICINYDFKIVIFDHFVQPANEWAHRNSRLIIPVMITSKRFSLVYTNTLRTSKKVSLFYKTHLAWLAQFRFLIAHFVESFFVCRRVLWLSFLLNLTKLLIQLPLQIHKYKLH